MGIVSKDLHPIRMLNIRVIRAEEDGVEGKPSSFIATTSTGTELFVIQD